MKDTITSSNPGEIKTFDCIHKNLPDDIICYHNREVKGYEFDFCLLIKNIGIMIIEVKGWHSTAIEMVKSPDEIYIKGEKESFRSPKKQSRAYRFNLINTLHEKYQINPYILDMVCYPFISEKEYISTGLNIVSESDFTLFKEDIEDKTNFTGKLIRAFQNGSKTHTTKLNSEIYNQVRSYFENSSIDSTINSKKYSSLLIFPLRISLQDIDSVLKEYFDGIKQVIFLNHRDDLVSFVQNLDQIMKKRNIYYYNGTFYFNSQYENYVNIETIDSGFSIFNFEIFLIPDLETITRDKIKIVDGQCSDKEISIIKHLSKVCGFNVDQYEIEHAPTNCDIQVKAGAGTGKTYSMVSRISFLCHKMDSSLNQDFSNDIAMMTFTVDAAINMKSRLKKQFVNYFVLTQRTEYLNIINSIERMRISTIHSFAKDIIQRTSIPLGIGMDFSTVTGDYNRRKILKRFLNQYLMEKISQNKALFFNLPVNAYKIEEMIIEFITKIYQKGCDIKSAAIEIFGVAPSEIDYLNELIEEVIIRTENEYSKELINNNSLSLNEYMLYLNKCIDDKSFNEKNYTFKYLFVDEFQDVDDSQIHAFLKMKTKLKFSFFIVGDLKQSIYRFRGSTMDAFTKMGCDNNNWRLFTLTKNYRTDNRILDKLDKLFVKMGAKGLIPYSFKDKLSSNYYNNLSDGELIEKKYYTKDDKLNGTYYDVLFSMLSKRKTELEILDKVKPLSNSERTIAILVRTNSQAKTIISRARKNNIQVESDASGNLYKLQSSIDLCKLTAALTNPYNEIYLFDLLMSNNINLVMSSVTFEGMNKDEKKVFLIECLDKYYMSVMQKKWSELIYKVQNEPVLKVLRDIYLASKPWKKYSKNLRNQTVYRMNYELLFEQLTRINKRSYLTLNSINESLSIAISTGLEEKSRDFIDDNNSIRIICTTVHRSKGLEYDTVVLTDTTDPIDIFRKNTIEITYIDGKIGYLLDINGNPVQNDNFLSDNELNEIVMEESRILYVALTRTINKLIWFKDTSNIDYNWGGILEEVKDI